MNNTCAAWKGPPEAVVSFSVTDGVVLGAPDVEQQHGQGGGGEALQHQHLHHVRLLVDDGAIGADQHHQAVADEEADQAGQHRHPGGTGEAGPVGGLGGAADEGAEHQGDGGGQVQAGAGLDRQQAGQTAGLGGGHAHGQDQQQRHGRHGDPGEDLQAAVADVGGGAEAQAEHRHQRQHRALLQAEVPAQHHGSGGRPPGIPADLGEAEDEVAQLAAAFAKGEAPHQHRVEAAATGDMAEGGGIETQQQIAEGDHPQQVGETEGHPQLAAGEHGGGEEGEAQQHHGQGGQPLAGVGRDFAQGIVVAGVAHKAFLGMGVPDP